MTRVSEQSHEILYGGSLEVFEIKLCKLPELVPKMGIPDGMNGIVKTIFRDGEVDVLPVGCVLQSNERNSPTGDLEGDFVLIWQIALPSILTKQRRYYRSAQYNAKDCERSA